MVTIDFKRLRHLINTYEVICHEAAKEDALKVSVYYGAFAAELEKVANHLKFEAAGIVSSHVKKRMEEFSNAVPSD